MRRLRRLNTTTTIELTPMIDVVFLLLTFFIFSIALMVRADVLGVSLPDLISGVEAERVEPITVTLRADGSVSLMGEAVARERLVEAIRSLRQTRPDAPVLLAADVEAGAGQLIELADALVRLRRRDADALLLRERRGRGGGQAHEGIRRAAIGAQARRRPAFRACLRGQAADGRAGGVRRRAAALGACRPSGGPHGGHRGLMR